MHLPLVNGETETYKRCISFGFVKVFRSTGRPERLLTLKKISKMKLKAVTVAVMVVVILQIAGNAMAKSCFEDCSLECKGDTRCLGICLGSCTGDGAQKPLDHHDLCKLGCTLDRCLKYSNGTSSSFYPFSMSIFLIEFSPTHNIYASVLIFAGR